MPAVREKVKELKNAAIDRLKAAGVMRSRSSAFGVNVTVRAPLAIDSRWATYAVASPGSSGSVLGFTVAPGSRTRLTPGCETVIDLVALISGKPAEFEAADTAGLA